MTLQQVLHGELLVESCERCAFTRFNDGIRVQIIQYTVSLVVPFLQWRARLQHGAGLRKAPSSPAADKLAKLASLISDARMFFRIWGALRMKLKRPNRPSRIR